MNRVLFSILCLLLLFPITAQASTIQLPQSGQTKVYSAADDGDLRTGRPWPNQRFSYNGNQTVTDHLTGLIWTKDANLIKNRDPGFDTSKGDGAVSWQQALDYIHKLNQEKYQGFSDWRLPNLSELVSLVNQGQTSAATWLNGQGFAGVQPHSYWSSSTNVLSTTTAWTVDMADGPMNYLKKSRNGYIWPVRGGQSGTSSVSGIYLPRTGQVVCFDSNGTAISCAGTGQDGELQTGAAWPQPRFSDNGDQTVTDNLTGMIWTRDANLMITRNPSFDVEDTNSDGAVIWQDALDYVKMLNQEEYLGFSDWRLPNRIELASVMNYVEANPFAWLNWQGIFNVRNNYWTSATVASTESNAWNVYTSGTITGEKKSAQNIGSFVWPVRSGLQTDDPAEGNATVKPVFSGSSETPALQVATSVLPDGCFSSSYSAPLVATGGVPPYSWLVTSGSLPVGLWLNTYSNTINGTSFGVGNSAFTLQASDASGAKATQNLTITTYMLVAITTTSLPPGTANVPYLQGLTATGGKRPYTWSLIAGNLPAGLSLDPTGIITGKPANIGSSTFTVQATDINANTAPMRYTIAIREPLTVTAVSPPPNSFDVTAGKVSASFNKALDLATITNGSFTVSRKEKLSGIAAGQYHIAVLKSNGTVAAWGSNGYGQTAVPADLTGVDAIAAGASHTVALKNDGTVVAWGDNEYGQSEAPADLSEVIAVAAGGTQTVALRSDGSVVVWGSNYLDQSMLPSGVVAIAAGEYHSVALKADGTVAAWGNNGYGQTAVPSDLSGVIAVAAGGAHTVALKGDGTVVAWGRNGYGQTTVPPELSGVVAVAAGGYHTVALKNDGTLVAWGDNEVHQTDIPAGLAGVAAITAGYDFTVALKSDGTMVSWGGNDYGQATIPAAISGVVAIAAGGDHTVSLKGDRTVAAWGYNEYGQTDVPVGLSGVFAITAGYDFTVALMGDGTMVAWGDNELGQTDIPAGLSGVVSVSSGDSHTLALKGNGTVVAWGNNDYSQTDVPASLSGVVAVAAGDYHSLALKGDGTVVEWGDDEYGQATVPFGLTGVIAVAAGVSHTVALKGDGTVIAWGDDEDGQSSVPAGLNGVVAVAAGDYHSVALKGDGTLVAWGYDEYGQTDIPAGLSGVVAVAAGGYHTVALKGDGTVVVWGDNYSGQGTAPASPYETPLAGTVTWSTATLAATYLPVTPLPAGAMIKAFLSQAIKDQEGMHLSVDVTWNFATATSPLGISTTTLAEGTVGFIYNRSMKAIGGIAPYSWSISSGTLPAGLRFNPSTGVITGIPTADCNSSITFSVTDSGNNTATKALSIAINYAPLAFTTNALADGYVGSAYSQQVAIYGGKPPHTWLIASDALPAGLSLDASTGVISGTPTTSGSRSFTVQVKDANNTTITKSLTMSVYTLPSISTPSLTPGYTGLAYNQTLTANGGKPPYSWSSDFLPYYGLSLETVTGIISGIPVNSFLMPLNIQVKDTNDVSASKTLGLVINAPPTINTTTLPDGVAGTAYNQNLSKNNGMPPFSWSVISGALPTGLSLNSSTGVIAGTPSTAGSSTFTVQLLDAYNFAASKTLAITVNAPLTITTPTLADGHAGIAYSQNLEASGGKTPFNWSVTGGSLPAGLLLSTAGVISGTPVTTGSTGFTLQAKDANNFTVTGSFTITLTDAGSISGIITDRDSGAPLQGVTVTLNLTGITSKDPDDILYSCNEASFVTSDYSTVASNDGSRFACSTPVSTGQSTTFKVRNPFGSADALSMKWTGTSALVDDEYLAQSFRPTRDGTLTKVSFTASGLSVWGNSAWVYVQLKTSLNGAQEAVLAESQASSFPSTLGYSEKEFTFPAPVQLLAGQEYFLVLKGDYFYYHPDIIKPIEFIDGPLLSSAPAYSRNGGVWGPAGSTMVFKTFIEDLQDVVGPNSGSPPYLLMFGDTEQQVAISALNHTTGLWEYGGNLTASSEGDVVFDGDYFTFSKGDSYLTIERNVNGAMSNYYDQNGWITVRVENLAPLNSSLITDQFSLTYNRTLTAVTDVNGAYSFTSLPDGSYTLTFDKAAYATGTTSSTLLPGQTISSGSNIAVAPEISATSPLAPGMIDIPYSLTLTATSAFPPFSWSIISGALPSGLTLDGTTGTISGTPTSPGNYSFAMLVKDSMNTPASKSFAMAITGSASISGTVTDQATGEPLSGVNVVLALTGITSRDAADKVYSCNNSALSISDFQTIAANDAAKFSCLSGGTDNTMLFKVRNPYGAVPFSISWNGMLGASHENLAQSYRPTSSGNLTKVSFYLPQGISNAYYAVMVGELHVQLKTGLGGDAGTQLAESASIPIESLQVGTPQWVEFVFANPVQVTAGQEYFLEIQGRTARGASDGSFWWQYQPEAVSWGNGMPFAIGSAYSRQFGLWSAFNHSLAFRTYVNDNPDTSLDPATDNGSTNMYGIIGEYVRMSVLNRTTGSWDTGGNVAGNLGYLDQDPSMGGHSYRGDDLTIDWTINNELDRYYDQNGWLMVKIDNYDAYWDTEPPFTSLVTDNFKFSFNRTLTAVTDANGTYSFPALPDGNYALTFEKPGYITKAENGILGQGQNLNANAAIERAAPATLSGFVMTSNGTPISGAQVAITDQVGTRTTTSDSDGNYLVTDIVHGAYTATFTAPMVQTLITSGTLVSGQAGILKAWMTTLPISMTVVAPLEGATIATKTVIVTGTAENAETVDIWVTNDPNTYSAVVVSGAYSLSIPLPAGALTLTVHASNRYGKYKETLLNVNRTSFTLKNLGDSSNITVMELDGSFDSKNPDGTSNNEPRREISKEYFKTHADLDFLVMLSTFDYAMHDDAAGFYSGVKNDVQGINQPIFDNSVYYGSQGKLQGTIDMGNVSVLAAAPYGPKLDETVATLNHELMHRFGSYVRFKNPDGTLNSSLVGKGDSHWSYLLDSKGSLMLGCGWKNNGNGTFTSTTIRNSYSPLDLYLMGMIPKEQVPPMLLIDNPAIDKTKLPELGATINGTAKTVTIDDIIGAEGPRIPDSTTSQKKFNVGFVLLTRAGDNATAATQAIETLRSAWSGRLTEQTNGIAGINGIVPSVSVAIDSPAEGATITGPDVTVSGAVINTTGVETGVTINGISATVSGSRFILNHVPLQQGDNSISITATDANGLTATTARSVTASPGHYIRITSNMESGTAPMEISLRLNGSFIVSTPQIAVTGPVSAQITALSDTEFSTTLSSEGVYTLNAIAVGPDRQTYTDSVTITVMSRYQMETLLQGKWDGINSKISQNDLEGALQYIRSSARSYHRELFTALGNEFPQLSAGTPPLEFVYATEDIAKCRVFQQETVLGESVTVGYPVYFEKEDGIWRLKQY